MVPRILREGICRPSKFRRPKFNMIYSIERSTSSNQPPDGVDMCKKYQRTIDYSVASGKYDDPNKLRPTVYIAHTTVFDASKDSGKNTETLLESLQRKIASQQKIRHNLAVDEAQNNESTDEVTVESDKKGDHFAKDGSLQTDNVWRFATINDSDVTRDGKPKTEPIHENDGNMRPAPIRYRYDSESEAQAFDELAKKYLTMERDQVDKWLLEDLERLGLPINTSEALSPPININVSCEKEDVGEVVAPKPVEPQQTELIVNNPQYYDQISWCNLYFNESEILSSEEGVRENDKVSDMLHYDMLPLHFFLEFDPFDKSCEINKPIGKLGFEEHDDILPFHLLQCQDFIELDLKVSNDKIVSQIESINIDENLPIHVSLQENLINEIASPSNTIEATEQYDFITPFEELYDCDTKSEPVADIFHSLMIQDADVTKFDYTFPRDYTNVEISLNNQHQTPKSQTVKDTSQESRTIIQLEDQTMAKKELKEDKEDELKPLSVVNLAKPNVEDQKIYISQKVQQATNDNKCDTIIQANPEPNPKTEVELRNFINAKIMEQVRAYTPSENTTRPNERLDRLVQINPQSLPNHESKPLSHVNLVEPKFVEQQIDVFQNVQKAMKCDTIVPPQPVPNPKTETELRNFINASVMEQVGAQIASKNTTQPHERLDGLVQMNPQSLPNNDVTNIIHAKVLEQVGAPPPKLRQTTNSIKGIDSILQMQPQAAFEIKPQKVAHNEPLTDAKIANDNSSCQKTPKSEKAQIASKTREDQNNEQLNINIAVKSEETKQQSRETGTIVQSCVQTAPSDVDDATNKLSLDLNLSLSELLRRVRARNRLQYLHDIKAQVENMSILNSEKRCPPSDRPQCPPPPECTKPCPPPPKPKCPPEPPKCPPDPPKCPPEPPKCPPPKEPPKCPPDPPKCPPEPPKCPPEPKCPCPCPPPPKSPPEPPKCPCQATNVDDPVTINPYLSLLDAGTGFLRIAVELIKKGFLESRNMLFPDTNDRPFEIASLKLNRIRDFEPWTPVPSWPFPVQHKKRKLQCPYHGCPYPKPGPVRPNCPELPCAGFPKRLCFSETDIHYFLKTD